MICTIDPAYGPSRGLKLPCQLTYRRRKGGVREGIAMKEGIREEVGIQCERVEKKTMK